MAEAILKFTGGKAAIALIAIIAIIVSAIIGYRWVSLSQDVNDSDLLRAVKRQLQMEYFPEQMKALQAAVSAGQNQAMMELAASVLSTKLDVSALRASHPAFSFSSPQKVIVKVSYAVKDETGGLTNGVRYYQFKFGAMGNNWQYERDATATRYYLNFM